MYDKSAASRSVKERERDRDEINCIIWSSSWTNFKLREDHRIDNKALTHVLLRILNALFFPIRTQAEEALLFRSRYLAHSL